MRLAGSKNSAHVTLLPQGVLSLLESYNHVSVCPYCTCRRKTAPTVHPWVAALYLKHMTDPSKERSQSLHLQWRRSISCFAEIAQIALARRFLRGATLEKKYTKKRDYMFVLLIRLQFAKALWSTTGHHRRLTYAVNCHCCLSEAKQ